MSFIQDAAQTFTDAGLIREKVTLLRDGCFILQTCFLTQDRKRAVALKIWKDGYPDYTVAALTQSESCYDFDDGYAYSTPKEALEALEGDPF